MDVATRIARARIQLLLKQPFLGTLALSLRVQEREGCPTMATDGKGLYYNKKFVESLSDEHLEGVVAHELVHVMYQHVLNWRGEGKVLPVWIMATEYVTNEAVTEMFGYSLPGEPFLDKKFFGMYTEQVYHELLKKYKKIEIIVSPGDGEGIDVGELGELGKLLKKKMVDQHGVGDGKMTPQEKEELGQEIRLRVAQAAQAARMRGKLPAGLERILGDILNPKIPWRQVLAEFVMGMSRDDYSWKVPNKRHAHRGFILPSIRSETLEVAVAVDTSGSIGPDELTEFWSEVKGIMGAFPSYKIHFLACDAAVHCYEVLEPWSNDLPGDVMKGGGGTSFVPVMNKLEEEAVTPRALIYLTDAYGDFGEEPNYPVLWIVKGNGEVPWGRRCEL